MVWSTPTEKEEPPLRSSRTTSLWKIKSTRKRPSRFLRQNTDRKLRETTDEENSSQISKLKNRKVTSEDGIRNKHLKEIRNDYIKDLTKAINAIIWILPSFLKKCNGDLPQNHRQISLLPSIAKLTELIILIKLTDEIETTNVPQNNRLWKYHAKFKQKTNLYWIIFGRYNSIW